MPRLSATIPWILVLAAASGGCTVDGGEVDLEEVPYDPADEEQPWPAEPQAAVLTAPIAQRAGAWWGDTATPLVDQVWGEVKNSTPGKNLTSPFTYQWSCQLPVFPGNEQTLRLSSTSFSVNSDVQQSWSNPAQNQTYSFTLDPAKYPAGWVEIRIRCKGTETVGPETGQVTAITIGFPVQLRGGTSSSQNHNGTNYVDTHGWYDRGVDYAYATILNISDLVAVPQKGTITLKLRARVSGDTRLDHFMLKIDGVPATLATGQKAEFFGAIGDRTFTIDTTKLSNGKHVLAMHSHGIELDTSERPGQQIAAQSEVTIDVQNGAGAAPQPQPDPTPTPDPTPDPTPTPTPAGGLSPVADATVRGGAYATQSFGGASTLEIKDASADYDRETFLLYDLTGVDTAGLTGSSLSIPVKALPNGSPVSLEIGLIAGHSWSETALTYANRSTSFTPLATAQVSQAGTIAVDLGRAPSQLGAGRFTLVVRTRAAENRMVQLASREGGDPPRLHLDP